ncbi:DUF421 domain-containing protein [Alteribacter natronophilus]|uniref:DUF421 domain-containing protein n=1 Tax=Alteribacter natronophilus TaxID=2583810 RepID=UPI00110EDDC0|nr:DUF421 domain-containing protein [Alteribacter natronophilus]TMW73654.1 DUF421 domain-containing protein [Alteribacter natronophilus]
MPGWLEVILRTVSAVVLILASARLLVRKNIQHMTQTEVLLMAFFAAMLGVGTVLLTVPAVYPLIGFFAASMILFAVQILKQKSRSFRMWLQATPVPVIKDGKILEDEMKKQRFSTDDLEAGLRKKGVFNLQDVEFAMLEDTGEVDVLLKSDRRPVTAKDLRIEMPPGKESVTVVRDGSIQDEGLNRIGLSRKWIEAEIEARNLTLDNVFFAQADGDGQLYVDVFDDKLPAKQVNDKRMLLTALIKAEAELQSFAVQTGDQRAAQMYELCAFELEEVKGRVKMYLEN